MPFAQIGVGYESLHAQFRDAAYSDLIAWVGDEPRYVRAVPFDPAAARYFPLVRHRLELTSEEIALLRLNGFVSIDQGRTLSFPAAYQQVYTSDLPVLITTDSILHALHESYDKILKELETRWFRAEMEAVLTDCHEALWARAAAKPAIPAESLRDVDLYLSVARRLLHAPAGKPQTAGDNDPPPTFSVLGQEQDVAAIVADVDSLRMQGPASETTIYGGRRRIDYSQFKPRGHYTESPQLAAYFRSMLWLGRVDCGWNVLPTDDVPGVEADSERELRDAALLTELLAETGGDQRLARMDELLGLLVGRSDNLGPTGLQRVLKAEGITSVEQLRDAGKVQCLQVALAAGGHGRQLIRSQVLLPDTSSKPVPTPAVFQLFGQRFAFDSFVLSKVVHDEITYHGQKVRRMQPTGLDVMAALGNREAMTLLEQELQTWSYSANLMACAQLAEEIGDEFWSESTSNVWLGSLRELHADMTHEQHAPAAMRTRAWQRKQLQTQLASWSELRRDNILYTKQSYGVPGCAFPCGYVEPYPAVYRKLRQLAEAAQQALAGVRASREDKCVDRQIAFFAEMASTMQTLERIARKELKAEPLSEEEVAFLRGTFDHSQHPRFGSGSLPAYGGWYCRLYYEQWQDPKTWRPMSFKPTVADVHTDPHYRQVLQAGVGSAKLMVMAVEAGDEATLYVGPVYSYYEFWQPVDRRLNDQEWARLLGSKAAPSRPAWVGAFQAPPAKRAGEDPKITVQRIDRIRPGFAGLAVTIRQRGSGESSSSRPLSAETVRELGRYENLHSLDLSDTPLDDEILAYLSSPTDLRSLNLRGTKITDDGLKHLKPHTHLQFLDLSDTSVSDEGLASLENLLHLSTLDLRNTRVTEAGLRAIRQKLKHTEILH